MFKKLALLSVLVVVVAAAGMYMLSDKVDTRMVTNLPWQIEAEKPEMTKVFSVNVGMNSLSDVIQTLKKVPELAIFTDKDGSRVLEAYFARTKVGLMQARLTAEVDTEGMDLTGFAKLDGPGKPMPSGKRKYGLSKSGIVEANNIRVWKLVYLPTTNYSEEQIVQFFGKPENINKVNEQVENWLYPAKGLVVTYDKEGSEVFYYSARQEYDRLVASVPQVDNRNVE